MKKVIRIFIRGFLIVLALGLFLFWFLEYSDNETSPEWKAFKKTVNPIDGRITKRIEKELGFRCVAAGGAVNHDDYTVKYRTLWFSLMEKKDVSDARNLLLRILEIGIQEYRSTKNVANFVRDDFGVKNLEFKIVFSRTEIERYKYPNLSSISFINGKIIFDYWSDEEFPKTVKEERETLEEAIERSGREWDFAFHQKGRYADCRRLCSTKETITSYLTDT